MKNRGRNDPCVCGSGKKYKKCCMDYCPALEEDFKLGQQRILDFDIEQRQEGREWKRQKFSKNAFMGVLAMAGMMHTFYPERGHKFS
jgi:hypothetical protein